MAAAGRWESKYSLFLEHVLQLFCDIHILINNMFYSSSLHVYERFPKDANYEVPLGPFANQENCARTVFSLPDREDW